MVQGFKICRRTCGTWLKTKLVVEYYLAAKVLRQDVFIRDSDTDILEMLSRLSPFKSFPVCQIYRKDFAGEEKTKQGQPVSLILKPLQQILTSAQQCRFGKLCGCIRWCLPPSFPQNLCGPRV